MLLLPRYQPPLVEIQLAAVRCLLTAEVQCLSVPTFIKRKACPPHFSQTWFGINAAHNLGHFRSLVIEPRPARGTARDLQEPSRFNPPETCCRVWYGQSYEHGATPFPSRRARRDRRRKRTGRGHHTFHPSRTPIPRSVSTSICLCTLGWQVLAVEAHRNSRRGRVDG